MVTVVPDVTRMKWLRELARHGRRAETSQMHTHFAPIQYGVNDRARIGRLSAQ
jgi:hypothetical protein